MKRILAIDGGGLRGLFALQVLDRVESLLRESAGRADLVLADEFDMFAGTSTGAIIATALCWGMSVAEIERLYLDYAAEMFTPVAWYRRWWTKYRSESLADVFRRVFREDDATSSPAQLGSPKLRKRLLLIMRNATTGSTWPVTNNPRAKYNDPALADCNLRIPLWKLLRGGTAAPSYFAPEVIDMAGRPFLFVDGGMTPFNNPALIAVLMATLPCYQTGWPASRAELHVTSVGTGAAVGRLPDKRPQAIHLLDCLAFLPPALIGSIGWEQDMLCRVLGDCVFGAELDSEVGALNQPSLLRADEQKFTYVRYDTRFDRHDGPFTPLSTAQLDDLSAMTMLREAGMAYARQHVRLEHLFPRSTSHQIAETASR